MSTPTRTRLPGEGDWQTDAEQIHSQDSIAEVDDTQRSTLVSMWRSNTPGDNSLAWQVTQNGEPYPIQGANGSSRNAPSLVLARGYVVAFHRGDDDQIYWAFAALATPTAGSNFHLSQWRAIPGVTTSDTPVPVVIGDSIEVGYRARNSSSIYTIFSAIQTLLNGRSAGWQGNRRTGLSSPFAPALAVFSNTMYLAVGTNDLDLLISTRRPSTNFDQPVSYARDVEVWGRPSIAIAVNVLDVVMLGNDPDGQQARSIYRRQFRILNNRTLEPMAPGWTADPAGWRSISPVLMYAVTLASRAALIWLVLRGAGIANGLRYYKRLTQVNRRS